jgi:hypothetical protein
LTHRAGCFSWECSLCTEQASIKPPNWTRAVRLADDICCFSRLVNNVTERKLLFPSARSAQCLPAGLPDTCDACTRLKELFSCAPGPVQNHCGSGDYSPAVVPEKTPESKPCFALNDAFIAQIAVNIAVSTPCYISRYDVK